MSKIRLHCGLRKGCGLGKGVRIGEEGADWGRGYGLGKGVLLTVCEQTMVYRTNKFRLALNGSFRLSRTVDRLIADKARENNFSRKASDFSLGAVIDAVCLVESSPSMMF